MEDHQIPDTTTSSPEQEFKPLKLFISYGHDKYAGEAAALAKALSQRGHKIFFDKNRLHGGKDWEHEIEKNLAWCDRVVLTMTEYSLRRPDGFCLNEIAKALETQRVIIPILLEEVPNGAPTSICRIQYLDMRDAIPTAEKPERFQTKFLRLCRAIEHDELDFEGGQQRLMRMLQPLNYAGDMNHHIARFIGRTERVNPIFFAIIYDNAIFYAVQMTCCGLFSNNFIAYSLLHHVTGNLQQPCRPPSSSRPDRKCRLFQSRGHFLFFG